MSHLNTGQLRVQAIKEDLKNVDLVHLNTFVDGISDPEPPLYRMICGKVQPTLETVTLKKKADRYDFGNVSFTESGPFSGSLRRMVVLTLKKGELDEQDLEPIPKDRNDPSSAIMHESVYRDLVALWKLKFEAINLRIRQINEVRSLAHNAPNMPKAIIRYGPSLSQLDPELHEINGHKTSYKRELGDLITKHGANKRKKFGPVSIPDSAKCDLFTRIPDQYKIDLFDKIAEVALPNFDNLMVAAGNVVSVYQQIGSEFKSLHNVIIELRSALTEVEMAYRQPKVEEGAQVTDDRVDESTDDTTISNSSGQEDSVFSLKEVPRSEIAGTEIALPATMMPQDLQSPHTPPRQHCGDGYNRVQAQGLNFDPRGFHRGRNGDDVSVAGPEKRREDNISKQTSQNARSGTASPASYRISEQGHQHQESTDHPFPPRQTRQELSGVPIAATVLSHKKLQEQLHGTGRNGPLAAPTTRNHEIAETEPKLEHRAPLHHHRPTVHLGNSRLGTMKNPHAVSMASTEPMQHVTKRTINHEGPK